MRNFAIAALIVIVAVFPWTPGERPATTIAAQSSSPSGALNELSSDATRTLVAQSMRLNPLAFTKNEGQWDKRVYYRANAGQACMWITSQGVYYQFTRRVDGSATDLDRSMPDMGISGESYTGSDPCAGDAGSDSFEQLVLKATFVGANPTPEIAGGDLMRYKCNYFIGNDPSRWYTDVPNYTSVVYKDVYAGIDLKFYGNSDGEMEYDFIISAGADPSQLAVRYEGAEEVYVDNEGQLVVNTKWGEFTERKLTAYQLDGEKRMPIGGEYVQRDQNTFGFRFSDEYEPTLALVVDPLTLRYSTHLGGSEAEHGNDIAIDSDGNVYVTGDTESGSDFPGAATGIQEFAGKSDAFVTKLNCNNSGMNALVYSTYLGGSNIDKGYGIAVDGSGNAYVTGTTKSYDFPPAALPPVHSLRGCDAFVVKLNAAGNSVEYSTFLGAYG
jgi:hypothetical protein